MLSERWRWARTGRWRECLYFDLRVLSGEMFCVRSWLVCLAKTVVGDSSDTLYGTACLVGQRRCRLKEIKPRQYGFTVHCNL